MVGDDLVVEQLAKLEAVTQKKIVRTAMRKSAKRVKDAVVQEWQSHADTGRTAAAMAATRVRSGGRSRRLIRLVWPLPLRDILGIPAGSPHYYPNAVEYGHSRAPAKAYTRRTVNRVTPREHLAMGHDIGDAIEREWGRASRNKWWPKR
jgi:hypothetical protein